MSEEVFAEALGSWASWSQKSETWTCLQPGGSSDTRCRNWTNRPHGSRAELCGPDMQRK